MSHGEREAVFIETGDVPFSDNNNSTNYLAGKGEVHVSPGTHRPGETKRIERMQAKGSSNPRMGLRRCQGHQDDTRALALPIASFHCL